MGLGPDSVKALLVFLCSNFFTLLLGNAKCLQSWLYKQSRELGPRIHLQANHVDDRFSWNVFSCTKEASRVTPDIYRISPQNTVIVYQIRDCTRRNQILVSSTGSRTPEMMGEERDSDGNSSVRSLVAFSQWPSVGGRWLLKPPLQLFFF